MVRTRGTATASMSALLCWALALAGTSGGLGKALATRALQAQAQAPPPDQNCTANATAGGYDCVVGGQTVHVNATANVTQVQAPGTIVWNNASSGDVTVSAPGVSVVCTTDAKGEQHCSVQTAWWGSSSTNATRANNTAPTPRPRLRGLAAARVEERGEAGGVRVEAGGPVTDSTTDCRPVPGQKGAYNCSYEGQWAQVTTDAGTNTTQVTAPGVRVHTNEGTGDMEVDAWGFHLVCRKDSKTGKTRCRTRNEWWPSSGSSTTTTEEDAEQTPTTVAPYPASAPAAVDEEEGPTPVMHLPPRVPTPATTTATAKTTTTIKAKELIVEEGDKAPILPYTPTGPATTRAPSSGYFPTEPQPPLDVATPATAVPLKGPAGAKQQQLVEADKGEPILPFTPTGAAAARPPTPGYFPEQPRPTLSPAEAEAAQAVREQGQRQQGHGDTRMADSVLVGPPAPVVVVPSPLPPQPMPAVAAVDGQPEPYVVVDPAVPQYEPAPLVQEARPGVAARGVYGQPVIAVDPPISDADMITAPRTVPPFPLLAATGGLDPQELQEEQQPATTAGRGPAAEPAVGGGDRPPVVKPTKPAKPTPPRAPAAPANDPLWQTNPKNCTRAAKGEGKGCWDEATWQHGKPKPSTTTKPPVPVPVGVGTGIKPGAGASGNGVAVPNPAAAIPQPAANAMQEVNGAATATAAVAGDAQAMTVDTPVVAVAVAGPEPQGRV